MNETEAKRLIEECGRLQTFCPDDYNLPCPRCGRKMDHTRATRNALSRYAEVYICSACGGEEASLSIAGIPPLPFTNWAIIPQETVEEIVVCRNCREWGVVATRVDHELYHCPFHEGLSKIVTGNDTCRKWSNLKIRCRTCIHFGSRPTFIIHDEHSSTVYSKCTKTDAVMSECSICNRWTERKNGGEGCQDL